MARSVPRVAMLLWLASCILAMRLARATVSPTIVSPGGTTQWSLGSVQTVKWVSDQDMSGLNGTIYLGYIQQDGNTFLWKDQPLAQNFSLADGAVNVRVPLNLPTSFNRYVLALSIDGDDSDLSGLFGILDRSNSPVTSTMSPPVTLSTTGGVPSATITRTSIVSTIGSSTASASSGSVSAPATTSSAVLTATQSNPTTTAGANDASNGASRSRGFLLLAVCGACAWIGGVF
ncbi:hypothetical protein BV20DRAFT_1038185 [Pilatotrama ljubarskyi]|nr:hypothetical protein BV20DRAFT_1038185 [Pilatotrama ljubarskyi]